MATSAGQPTPPSTGAVFDSVIAKDRSHKGVNSGEFKLLLDGLQKSDPAYTAFDDGTIKVWCEMKGQTYLFDFKFPEDAKIDASTISIPAKERSKGKLKVYFTKTSDFQLTKIF